MVGYVFLCKICHEEPDYVERQPVALPACGHSFCRVCLIRIRHVEGQLKCPFCRTLHEGRRPEELPINYAILEMMQSNESNSNGNPSTRETSTPADNNFDYNYPETKPTTSSDSSAGETEEAGDSVGHQTSNIWKWVGLGSAAVATAVLAAVGFKVGEGARRSLKQGLALMGMTTAALSTVELQSPGFTSAGIAAGSLAAGMMSSGAIAGGGVTAGNMVAALQSVGAAGIGAAGIGAAGVGAAGIGAAAAIGSFSIAALGATAFSKRLTRSKDDGNEAPGNADVITSDDVPKGFGREEDSSEDDDANSKEHDKKGGSDSDTHNGSSKDGGEREGGTRTNDSRRNIYVPGRGHRRVIYLHEILFTQQI